MNQEKIGRLIAKLRKTKGLTQSELGDMVGVGFRAVSKWENGITIPDISIINDLSKILGISADELLKGELNNNNPSLSHNFNFKKLLYIIPAILIITLSIVLININKNKAEIYKLVSANREYYVEGEVIFKGSDMAINITKLNFENPIIKNTMIKNYQYELYSNDYFIVGYGYTPTNTELFLNPISIDEVCETIKINYTSDTTDLLKYISKNQIIDNGITINISFINEDDSETSETIKILLIK